MIRQKPKRVIQIERLEDRNLLASTADIVLIVDDSITMTFGGPDHTRPVLDFVTEKFLPALDQKLAEYDIGTNPEEPNHFGLVTYGGGMTPTPEGALFDTRYQTWGPGGEGNSRPSPRPIPLDLSAGIWDPVDQTQAAFEAEAETLKGVYLAPIAILTDDPDVPGLAGKTAGGGPAGIINNLPEASGSGEDSWHAVDYVFTVEYHLDASNENDDPLFATAPVEWRPTGPLYDFRDNADVQFILISETGRVRHWGGDYPMLPWEVWTYDEDPEKNEWHPEPPVATDVEWDRWDNANLHSLLLKLNRAAEVPDDIDLTAFVPAKFRPLQNDPANPENHNQQFDFLENVPILGVDVNVIEGWDIDEHDPFGSVWIEGPAPPPENDDYVVFYAEGIDADSDGTIVNAGEIVETHIEGNLLDKDIEGDAEHGYREIIEELSCWEGSWCDTHAKTYLATGEDYDFFSYEKVDQEQIDRAYGGNGSGAHGVEEQAFLAWEARGTVWTSAYLGYDMYGGAGENDPLRYPPGFDPRPPAPLPPDYTEKRAEYNALLDLLGNAMAQDVVNKITGPRVTNVEIVGPNGADDDDGDDEGEYSIPVGNGEQLKTVPIGGANEIRITFSEDVKVSYDAPHYWWLDQYDLTLVGKIDNTPYGSGNVFSYDPDTRTATWTFADAFPADEMELTLGSFADRHRTWHDGDWTNPDTLHEETSDVFPSGDGSVGVGEEFVFHFTILPGDLDGNNIVGMNDYAVMVNWEGSGGSYAQGDLDGDGDVDNDDYQELFFPNAGRIFSGWGEEYLLADVNDDGAFDGLDIDPFVAAMLGGDYIAAADCDENGSVNGLDVDEFIQLVIKGGIEGLLPVNLGGYV